MRIGEAVGARDDLRERTRQRLLAGLSRFGPSVERVHLRLDTAPQGTVCRVRVRLRGPEPVVLEIRAPDPERATALATDRAERSVRRALDLWHRLGSPAPAVSLFE